MLFSLLQIWMLSRALMEAPEYEPPFVRGAYNVAYKEANGAPLMLDVLTPAEGAGPFPAVVIVHGGLWLTNDRLQYRDFALGLARRGFAAVNIDFRLDAASGFAGQVNDIKDAIRFLRANAALFAIDPDRIGIYGSSSGGHLAAMAAFAGDGEGVDDDPPGLDSAVQSCFLLYGVYRFDPGVEGFIAEIIADPTALACAVDRDGDDRAARVQLLLDAGARPRSSIDLASGPLPDTG